MQDKKIVLTAFLTALMVLSTTATSLAFIHPDGSEDGNFEIFGPRIDKLLIKKYANLDAEIAALQNGEIDITDYALTKNQTDLLSADPNIGLATYGGEAGYYTISLNQNNNSYLGNPPDPLYPNPVYPNPMSELALRQACAYLIDRETICANASASGGLYEPIYTPIPAYMKYWINTEIKPGGMREDLTYPYNITKAAEVLDNGGFPVGPDNYRYWDMNRNGVKDAGESLQLKFISRETTPRKSASDMLEAGFLDPQIRISYNRIRIMPGWMGPVELDDYHIYTAGWIYIGPDPDYLYDLYHWSNYWRGGSYSWSPNFGSVSINDPVMQAQLETIKYASNQTEALQACLDFQERFAATVSEIPLGVTSAPKAYNKWYTGGNDGAAVSPDDGENAYRGQMWTDLVNQAGSGENSWWTTLNAHPENAEYGNGHLTMRYGWEETSMPQIVNPLYTNWYWEYEVVNRVYDCLGARNPYTMGPVEVPNLAENWTVGTWVDPHTLATKTSVMLAIRPDVSWSDGQPFTVEDVIYTLVDLPDELWEKGWPPIWWSPFDQIDAVYRLDQYTLRILLNTNTYLAANWIIGTTMLPKHVWQPFIASHTLDEVMGDIAPQYLVGTGPFAYVENTPTTLTMIRNPYYSQRIPVGVTHYENSATRKISEGIAVAALPPSVQLRPFKIQSSVILPSARITVPVTNLDVDDSCLIHEKVEFLRHNGSVQTLLDVDKSLTALESNSETFDLFDLENGQHTIRVTIQITGGALYDYVAANLPPEQWQAILGPKTTTKIFWVTVAADVDESGNVDIIDIVKVAANFGRSIGDAGFKGEGDINMDGAVDILDIVLVAGNLGWHY